MTRPRYATSPIDLTAFDNERIDPRPLQDPNAWGNQQMVSPNILEIPPKIQRDAIIPHVKQIVANFNRKYFGVLTIARYTLDDLIHLAVVDGGQRLTAVNLRNKIFLGLNRPDQIIKTVPCMINDVANQKEAATIFLWIDEFRKRIAFEERHKAGLVAFNPKHVLAEKYYRRFDQSEANLDARERIFVIVNNPKMRPAFDAILESLILPLSTASERRTLATQVMSGLINLEARMALHGHSLNSPKIVKKILHMGPEPLADQCRAVASAAQHSGQRAERYANALAKKLRIPTNLFGG